MSNFAEFLDSLGIVPPAAIIPGRWTRCATVSHPRKKNAVIKLNDDETSGFAIDHSSMADAEVWRVIDNTVTKRERTAAENAALSARLALRRQEEIQGTMRAVTAYAKANPLLRAEHPYFQRKRLSMEGALGLKVDGEGWLVIPMFRDRKLTSIQRISPDDGQKRFQYGAPTKFCTFRIHRGGAPVTILCEGFATGAAIFSACPMANVEVCFSAANLIAVASRNQYGTVAVAGDNDPWSMCHRHKKENLLEPLDPEGERPEWCRCNPGKTAAMEAARILGCGYAVPSCEFGTDFLDQFLERLERLEKANEGKPWGASPHKLRQEALAPLRAKIMPCAKNNSKKV